MKTIKKLLAFVLSISAALTLTLSANAESSELVGLNLSGSVTATDESEDLAGFTLISEERFVDENNFYIVDRTYVENEVDTYSVNATKSGSKTIKKSRSIYSDKSGGDLWLIMWVQGDFSWNSQKDTATVENADRWQEIRDQIPDYITVSEKKFEYKSNQGMTNWLGGHKYASIEYIIRVANEYTAGQDFRIWLDVNINGDVNFQT